MSITSTLGHLLNKSKWSTGDVIPNQYKFDITIINVEMFDFMIATKTAILIIKLVFYYQDYPL
jgi:hypothetical protein